MRSIKAVYGGTCPECGEDIQLGERIVRPARRWIHERCAGPKLELLGDPEAELGRRERSAMNAEYAAGVEDARRWRENRQLFGDAYADAEEYARDIRGLNGDW